MVDENDLLKIHKEQVEEKFDCELCQDTGEIEVMGDGDNFEWDVVGIKQCSCQED
jgi:hypothetical protein